MHFIDDEELAYVMQRYRQAHDFVHTLTGLGVTVEEELALKWFEWVQTGLPMNMLSSLVGPFIVPWEARRRLFNVYVPWALQCGRLVILMLCAEDPQSNQVWNQRFRTSDDCLL